LDVRHFWEEIEGLLNLDFLLAFICFLGLFIPVFKTFC
jgi:hypothetical protein